jgi:pyruvate dehydrogenase E2 component (dihydrolipoamide acetyltransferase)
MDILMPQLGETVTEGTISKWYKSAGDTVAAGDALFEIETDKTSMEVPATHPGVLREIRAAAGQTVPVGAVVAVVAGAGEPAAAAPTSVAAAPVVAPIAAPIAAPVAARPAVPQKPLDPFQSVRSPERNFGPATLPGGAKVTPLARRLAAERGLDLRTLRGSGPQGRVVADDVRRAPAPGAAGTAVATGASATQVKAQYPSTPYGEVPLDAMRKVIARRLTESKQTVPHFYLSADYNVEALLAVRQQVNAAKGVKVSVNDLIVKAYAMALQKVPAANVVFAEDRLLQFTRSDVGVAVAVPGGLVTPVVRSADTKSVLEISAEIADLATRGRERKLKPDEYTGGSATVSNLGMYGVRNFSAIVNPPQATILAVGAAERRPIEGSDGSVRFASTITVTLSVDHRAVDGAVGGELLRALRNIIENPVSLFF